MKQKPTIIYENTVAGSFVRRINRFTAEVLIDGETELVHVKNTGRLQELLVPKAKVTLQKTLNMNRKTAYDLISVYKPKLKWVNIDSLAPNALMKQLYMSLNYDLVKAEHTYGDSRIDFYMEKNGEKFLTEVKGCTLADDLHPGLGLFPDAPTERGGCLKGYVRVRNDMLKLIYLINAALSFIFFIRVYLSYSVGAPSQEFKRISRS